LPKASLGDADEFGRTANRTAEVRRRSNVGGNYLLSTRARSAGACASAIPLWKCWWWLGDC